MSDLPASLETVHSKNSQGNAGARNTPWRMPPALLFVQVFCFAILYAIWMLPGTIVLRHICLGIGALLSLYPIYQSRHLFLQKKAIPIWVIAALFGWITFHLLFLAQDPIAQLAEFTSIWKRSAVGVIFALGMGISIAQLTKLANTSIQINRWMSACWIIFYMGLLAPTLIYLIKVLLTLYGPRWGITAPQKIQMYVGTNSVYVAKTAYVAFCLPVFAVALGSLLRNIESHRWISWSNLAYLATLPAVFAVFYSENIKNGVAYGLALVFVFLLLVAASLFKGRWVPKVILSLILLAASVFFLNIHLQQNDSWKTFRADAKVALNTSENQQWKLSGGQGYPNNALGIPVSATNYERIAWAKEGIHLIFKNPLGYGLVERSFGRLGKIAWPDSKLHQSHSGWIDFTLGMGVPGVALILGAIWVLLLQLSSVNPTFGVFPWVKACQWGLFCLLLIWCTTEISQKVYLDSLLFWIACSAGINLAPLDAEFQSNIRKTSI
jgi:hypothetical protein